MADEPLTLAVTEREAKAMTAGLRVAGGHAARVVLRLPERPTMPCPIAHCWGDSCPSPLHDKTIPEGERVEVGWWSDERNTGRITTWHPVATATLASVEKRGEAFMGREFDQYVVTLTDVEACHE